MKLIVLIFVLCSVIGIIRTDDAKPEYKMCVSHTILDACNELVANRSSELAKIICVPARDRIQCLEKVNKREADFVAVDPEDMYIAFQMKNEDFSVFSEIRTVEEPDAEFRYEGIILVRKNSDIHSLNDLQGKKSCHTGYGRNVGYKIPITKLKKHGVLKISASPSLSPLEKELKGLSDLFTESCLVGTYSPRDEVNRALKKRYANLCALCEDPVKCNYPDKYSGYEGAIRCLKEQNADVAFTKVIYVRKFFGLPINNKVSMTEAQANPDDYEYLCEDGSRRPVTGQACTWAQRPWQGYMGNADINTRLTRLQDRINEFYNEGKTSSNKEAAAKLWINEKNLVVKKEQQTLPGDHLIKAQYKDVIERDGSTETKIRLCVRSDIEFRKCETMKKAAYSRDIRPEFVCVMSSECIQRVKENKSDALILNANDLSKGKGSELKPIARESFDEHYLIVAAKQMSQEDLHKILIQYDPNDSRSRDAALNYNHKRGDSKCDALTTENSSIRVLRLSELKEKTNADTDEIICPNGRKTVTQPSDDLKDCFYDATPATTVFIRGSTTGHELDNIAHAFMSLSDKFGHKGKIEDVFELFGEFEPGQKNILFSDKATELIPVEYNFFEKNNPEEYNRLRCNT